MYILHQQTCSLKADPRYERKSSFVGERQREAISTPLFGAILPPPPLFYNPPPSALEPPILSSSLLSPSSSNYFSLSPLLKGTLFGERLKAAARSPGRPKEAPPLVLQQNMMPAQRHSWPRAAKAKERGQSVLYAEAFGIHCPDCLPRQIPPSHPT